MKQVAGLKGSSEHVMSLAKIWKEFDMEVVRSCYMHSKNHCSLLVLCNILRGHPLFFIVFIGICMYDKQFCIKVLFIQTYSIQVIGLEISSPRQERVLEGGLMGLYGLPAVSSVE
jgi:hypothetical protein